MFPTCEIASPRPDERVTVLYANGGAGLSPVALGNIQTLTEVVDVEVTAGDRPHYIAISSGKPIIWRFSGDIESISRVVVLGSQYRGQEHTGIVGIPREQIIYAKTDLKSLGHVARNTCLSVYRACELSAHFEIPKADRMKIAYPDPNRLAYLKWDVGRLRGLSVFEMPKEKLIIKSKPVVKKLQESVPTNRIHVDQFVERLRAHTIRIPQDGWSEAEKQGRWGKQETKNGDMFSMSGPAEGRYEPYGGGGYEGEQNYERGVINISAKDVVTSVPVLPYTGFPGVIGLQQLISEGVLFAPGTPEFDRIYKRWDETISAPYRSRFDPDFSFGYKVDYLVTKETQLPIKLHEKSFLIADGVEMPDLNQNSAFNVCFFFADSREIPKTVSSYDNPRCDRGLTQAIPDDQSAFGRSRAWIDGWKISGGMAPKACLVEHLEKDVHLVVLALAEGDYVRYYGQKSPRRFNVKVERTGKIALYLNFEYRYVDWHIISSPETEIVGVFTRLDPNRIGVTISGLDKSVQVKSMDGDWRDRPQCGNYSPNYSPHLGGPAIMRLDESLNVLLGKRIDAVIRETNDGSWPKVSDDPKAERLTIVIK
ncbi:MAG: hypothetical protein JKY49_16795 [Cohaesibacteraceae bacterium]|nr:hypothetical protein [Cohaesibacteraceae bacterium]MBL4876901.1 hypothetical protein [Cohaesibacteraceae bacterium]